MPGRHVDPLRAYAESQRRTRSLLITLFSSLAAGLGLAAVLSFFRFVADVQSFRLTTAFHILVVALVAGAIWGGCVWLVLNTTRDADRSDS
jgi:membrane protein DedA with SNARE-associated domain